MKEQLLRIIVDGFVFLELSNDRVVDPDAAITQNELTVGGLSGLEKSDRDEMLATLRRFADHEQDQERSAVILALIESIEALTEQ